MTFRIVLLSLLVFVKISACKCEYTPTLSSSFKNADFVFIGEVEGYTEAPSGFKTSQNILSRVRIDKVYKYEYNDQFYKDFATLFASPIRSCDVPFTEKGKFLIFAYFEEDTGFLYSEHCLLQKRADQLSPEDLKELETLSTKYKNATKNSEISANENPMDVIIEEPAPSNRKINDLKTEISDLDQQNDRYKIIIYVATFAIAMLLITLGLVWRKKNKQNV